ncbi:MAG TPA: HlyD family secretion protein [Verrucomicrobiae bacterium]|jgi:membrane fusion protein (multidrug efflux system)|nr:HlyD family secretion protein [Verrucomicrobiae bacterium]
MSDNTTAAPNPATQAPQSQPQPQPQQAAPPAQKPNGGNGPSPLVIGVGAVVLAALLFYGLNYFATTLTSESTDDAFIAGHIVSIAPRISGQVAAVHVLDNEFVRSNQLLVELDPSDYNSALGQKQAAQDSAQSNLKAAIAGYNLMKVKVKTAEADARETKADAAASAATAARAQADFERAKQLQKENTISPQEYDQARASADEAQANLNSANAKAASDESKVDEAQAQLAAAKAEADAVLSQLDESKTEVDSAQLNVSYTKIYAPCDGLVTRKQVEAGDYLQAGQTIFSIVPRDVWVTANFKESQLADMQTNQTALVTIDALGGKTFRAHVNSVQAGSGAVFSLLPPENAVGNYVKVVQRVPVKIVFDEALPAGKTIGPGLSVVPTVLTSTVKVPKFLMAIVAIILAVAAAVGFKTAMKK